MSLEEAILEKVRRLPPAKQQEVLRFADGLQRNAGAREVPSRDRSSEMKWLDENRAAYRELAAAGLMMAGHSFAGGDESVFRLTKEGFERKAELLACAKEAG